MSDTTTPAHAEDRAPERVFLGWQEPILARAAEWLLERGRSPHTALVELDHLLVVVPGRRAARRLRERLAVVATRRYGGMLPPQVVTPGALGDLLVHHELPAAKALVEVVERAAALAAIEASALQALLPHPPEATDLGGLLVLARALGELTDELALAGLDVRSARKQLEKSGQGFDDRRWSVLERVENELEKRLSARGLVSRSRARVGALAAPRRGPEVAERVVLVGVPDLGQLWRRLLAQSGSAVSVLIQAPADLAAGFDRWGGLVQRFWTERGLDLARPEVVICDKPQHQVERVVETVKCALRDGRSADECTVGLTADDQVRAVEEGLQLAGVGSHSPLGRTVTASPPVRLIVAWSRFFESQQASDLAALLRHPDATNLLPEFADDTEPEGAEPEDIELEDTDVDMWAGEDDTHAPLLVAQPELLRERLSSEWIAWFDRYSEHSLLESTEPPVPGHARDQKRLTRLVRSIVIGTAEGEDATRGRSHTASRRAPETWRSTFLELLHRAYRGRDLSELEAGDRETAQALTAVAEGLEALGNVTADWPRVQAVSASEAASILELALSSRRLATEAAGTTEGHVEVLGWLELAHDDVPFLVVMGMNEGLVPQGGVFDALLPDGTRRTLGLLDDSRRLARDRFILEATINSRERITLLAGRRSALNDPLLPSRLLLETAAGASTEARARRVLELTRMPTAAPGCRLDRDAALTLGPTQIAGMGLVPPDAAHLSPPARDPFQGGRGLGCTALAQYVRCPYRFWLRYVRGLEVARDLPREIDARAFGILLHQVLDAWVQRPDATAVEDSETIKESLFELLERGLRVRFGARPSPIVEVQATQMKRRLEWFALWQAEQASRGWRAVPELCERSLTHTYTIAGEALTVRGRIDRVDLHPELGLRVIDYKTSERGRSPSDTHGPDRNPDPDDPYLGFHDFQLPIYLEMVKSAVAPGGVAHQPAITDALVAARNRADRAPEDSEAGPGGVVAGYVQLSAVKSDPRWLPARWSRRQHQDAERAAAEVLSRIRSEVFWPPGEPPLFDDGFTRLALDRVPNRPLAIAHAEQAYRGREPGELLPPRQGDGAEG